MASETMSTAQPDVATGNLFLEKRREARYSTCDPVEVYLLDMQGLRLPGILKDISRSGLRIELGMPLKAGDRLEVVLENCAIFFGQVRYCRRVDESYHAGVLIGDILYPKAIAPAEPVKSSINAGASDRIRAMPPRRPASPAPSGLPGTHISPKEADGFFRGQLSDTKSALIDRHLTSCKKCVDLVLLTLEKKLSTAAPARGAKDVCQTQLH